MGKPIYFAGSESAPGDPAVGVWVVSPPLGSDDFEFLMISRDGHLRKGKMVMSQNGDEQNRQSLQAMIAKTEELDD